MKFNETKDFADIGNFNNLLLVDSLNFAFRYSRGNNKNFAEQYVDTIKSFAKSYECNKIVITGDWGSYYRKEVSPLYKANRLAKRQEQTEEEADKFKAFLAEYNRALEILKGYYPVLKFKGVEADDIIAYIAERTSSDYHTWIISSDKDLDQLISNKVSRFGFITRKEITVENWNTHYDYPLEAHIDIKCLEGDKGDNVEGVSGVGPKKAQQLVEQYGGIYDIIGNLPIDSKYKYIQNLNAFGKEGLLLNAELMDLQQFCVEALLNKENIDVINNLIKGYNK